MARKLIVPVALTLTVGAAIAVRASGPGGEDRAPDGATQVAQASARAGQVPADVFHSSFAAGDILDGGRFFDRLDAPALLRVVPSPHDGWPPNALEIRYAEGGGSLIGARGWRVPEPGERIFYRVLFANHLEVDAPISTDHGMQSNVGLIRQTLIVTGGVAGGWGLGWGHNDQVGGYRQFTYYTDLLPKQRPLRIEWGLERVDRDGVWVRLVGFRVHDGRGGRQLAAERSMTGFVNSVGAGRPFSEMGEIEMGEEGLGQFLFGSSGSGRGASGVTYLTGICVRIGDWCGPWEAGEGG